MSRSQQFKVSESVMISFAIEGGVKAIFGGVKDDVRITRSTDLMVRLFHRQPE